MEPKKVKVTKSPIRFQIELNKEQKEAKEAILANKITILRGMAGSGKTMVAIQVALDLLFHKEVNRIILSRSIVTAGEELGILPGGIDSKLEPYIAPLSDALYDLYGKVTIDNLLKDDKIRIIPVGLMRGRNLKDCIAIVDEAQNLTHRQLKLLQTRLCKGSKLIFCGDIDQIDLNDERNSGFDFICGNMRNISGYKVVTLLENHRDEIVNEILEVYKNSKL